MNISQHLAKNLREVYSGGNWTGASLKQQLEGITWQHATAKVNSFNTIATLVYHIGYYVTALLKVLQNRPLDSKDEYSFNHPPIESEADWNNFLEATWAEMETVAALIEQYPEDKLMDTFVMEKYGTYYRNFTGLIEHTHYHTGQIALIRKILLGN